MAIIHYIEKHLTTYEVKFHSHKYWEIIYVTSGKGCLQTADGKELHYKKDDLLFIPPSLMHANHSETGFRNIFFSIENWNTKLTNPTVISNPSTKDLLPILEQTHKYSHKYITPSSQEKKLIFSLVDVIEGHLERILGDKPQSGISLQIEAEIISNYTDPEFDLSKVYEKFPYHKEWQRKTFTEEMGISPSQYLLHKRIDCAVRLLSIRESFDPINIREISEKCGFSDPFHFSRVFKKIMGMSPSQYMKKLEREPEPHHQWKDE